MRGLSLNAEPVCTLLDCESWLSAALTPIQCVGFNALVSKRAVPVQTPSKPAVSTAQGRNAVVCLIQHAHTLVVGAQG